MPVGPDGQLAASGASRLRSVFLQHRLIAQLPPLPGVAPVAAKFVVEQIAERLLAIPGGTEPLMLPEREAHRLGDGIAVAVLAVALARAVGWPPESLADLGAVALLTELGSVLAPRSHGRAAFAWFLARGADDFWLRCALVAHRRGDVAVGGGAEDELATAQIVQVASAVRTAAARGPVADWRAELSRPELALPVDLVAIAPRLFAAA